MSRPRSSRGNTPAPARAGARPGVFVQAPKSDIYVAMLAIALGAMFLGTILLVLILARYDFKTKVAENVRPASTFVASMTGENSTTVRL